ncbi:MAG: hypothetical protein M3P04_04575 [Actinomycetota bacterium]|nr:hypothetical protein [Actinomycetota bacterium]
MTTLTVTAPTAVATVERRLRSVLRADAVVTAAVGLFGLVGPSWYGGPAWVARAAGAVLLLVGIEVGLMARSEGNRLRLTGVVVAELAFAWVVAVLIAAGLVDMDTAGREVLVLTAVVTLAFGVAETRLTRRMR